MVTLFVLLQSRTSLSLLRTRPRASLKPRTYRLTVFYIMLLASFYFTNLTFISRYRSRSYYWSIHAGYLNLRTFAFCPWLVAAPIPGSYRRQWGIAWDLSAHHLILTTRLINILGSYSKSTLTERDAGLGTSGSRGQQLDMINVLGLVNEVEQRPRRQALIGGGVIKSFFDLWYSQTWRLWQPWSPRPKPGALIATLSSHKRDIDASNG